MNIKEIIASGVLESYVVGTASDEEIALINDLCKKHPELLSEIEAIEKSLLDFSARIEAPLNPALKNKIAAQLFMEEKVVVHDGKIVSITQNKLGFYKFAMAASLLLFVSSFFYAVLLQKKLNTVMQDMAALSVSKSYMADELKVNQASLTALNSGMRIMADPNSKKIVLKGMNSLYASSAAIHWNTRTSEVYFNAGGLPQPTDKQYQLWAIVDGKPVNAGMIELKGAIVFQKMKNITGAQAFAVTIEAPGGSATPSLETMCLLGNV